MLRTLRCCAAGGVAPALPLAALFGGADRALADATGQRALAVAVVGPPNAGKSALTNALVGAHVTAVSSKYNTTRGLTVGVLTEGSTQLVLQDTPGFVEAGTAGRRYEKALVTTAEDTIPASDVTLLVLDAAKRMTPFEHSALRRIAHLSQGVGSEVIIALNKVELVSPKHRLLRKAEEAVQQLSPDAPVDAAAPEVHYISAERRSGLDGLRAALLSRAVDDEWEFEEGVTTPLSSVELADELIREAVFARVQKEVPYTIRQQTTKFTRNGSRGVYIEHDLLVGRHSHRSILIGRKGRAIRTIAETATAALQEALQQPVKLSLRVKVDKRAHR